MNWKRLRKLPWLDTRAAFVARVPRAGMLLDIGSSDGETLGHFAELRPDIGFHATDLEGQPDNYPAGCRFHRGDIQRESLPWGDATLDAVTCMHLVEHLTELGPLFGEVKRLLKPGGRAYFETPHPKTVCLDSLPGREAGRHTLNFYDDLTHTRPVSAGAMAKHCREAGLEVTRSGTSRNWVFAAAWPVLWFAAPSRQRFTARCHWLGWSTFVEAERPR